MIGVGKFYLYDDYSYPPLAVAINDLITIGLVEYRFLLPEDKLEEPGHLKHDSVLNTCMAQYGNRHVFMGKLAALCICRIKCCAYPESSLRNSDALPYCSTGIK